MKKLLALFLILILVPSFVLGFDWSWPRGSLRDHLKRLLKGLPVTYYNNPKDIIYFIILPLIGSFLIIWQFLEKIRIFDKKLFKNVTVNMILAAIMTFALFYYEVITWIIAMMYSIGGTIAVAGFFAIFTVGVFLLGRKKHDQLLNEAEMAGGMVRDIGSIRRQIKNTRKELDLVREELTDTTSDYRRDSLKERQNNLRNELNRLRAELKALKR